MGIFDKLFPSEEQKLQSQVEELKKEIAALSNRRDLILKETKRIEAERDELKEDYEYEKEKVEDKRKLLNTFDDAKLQLMRHQIINEIFQQSTYFESDALRAVRENFDKYSLEEIKSILSPSKYAHRGILDFMETIMLPQHTFIEIADEYLKMCVKDLVKQMKSLDWETLRTQILAVTKKVKICGLHHNVEIPEQFEKDLFRMLEAKYLIIQKQIQIKEAEKEERQAQKDYEAAIKRANKKQEQAEKMLERKQQQLAIQQSEDKIQKLKDEIEALKLALKEAEEERQRAMSMAQQTKSGYVYIISNVGSFGEGVYKIGMTRRLDPMERVLELSNASVPFPFDVHAFIYSEDAPALETHLHRVFDKNKVNAVNFRKEYFRVSLHDIKNEKKKKGYDVDFIDEPLAMQYKESIIAKEIINANTQ